jgi:hypothetical protein
MPLLFIGVCEVVWAPFFELPLGAERRVRFSLVTPYLFLGQVGAGAGSNGRCGVCVRGVVEKKTV